MPCPDHPGHHIRCVVCEADNIAAAEAARSDPKDARIAELEAALRQIAEGQIDEGGNRRNHPQATAMARKLLRLE